MSYCELIAMHDGGTASIAEYSNSYGWCAYVWNALFEKYIEKLHEYDSWLVGDPNRVWDLAKRDDLSPAERVTLAATFDNVVVRVEDLGTVADLFDRFVEMYPPGNYVCHLPAMAEALREIHREPAGAIAVGWYGMSVVDNPWVGEWVDEFAYHEPYDITKGEKHWFLELAEFGAKHDRPVPGGE
jgi:hypothetical protein